MRDGRATLSHQDVLAGSILTMDCAVRNILEFAGCSISQALDAATKHPAQVLKLYPQKGSLQPGSDADVVIWKMENLQVAATIVAGHSVFINRDQLLPMAINPLLAP